MTEEQAMAKALGEYLSGAYCGELTECALKMIEKLKENGFKLTYIDTED